MFFTSEQHVKHLDKRDNLSYQIQPNPKCANRNKPSAFLATSRLLFSSAGMFKKPLWQTVWTQIRLLL